MFKSVFSSQKAGQFTAIARKKILKRIILKLYFPYCYFFYMQPLRANVYLEELLENLQGRVATGFLLSVFSLSFFFFALISRREIFSYPQ